MRLVPIRSPAKLFAAALLGAALAHATLAQQKPQEPASPSEDVVRTTTELVQTDVMVFDKQGAFIDGLKREQFELRVDKKPRTILFFERITAGSANEEAQLAAARGGASSLSSARKGTVVPLDRGRAVFFYVDDFHLSPPSVAQTRELLLRFIDREMGQNDEAAITSPSGQIGFLQQLTDNKAVLRRAVERLRARPYSVRDGERPPMSEYQALLIENNDLNVVSYFVEELVKQIPGISSPEDWVRSRARRILEQAVNATTNTLSPLESLVASSQQLPGRKLIFFVSDGFFLDPRREAFDRIRRVASAAARAGVVIYTIDARGLVASLTDASSDAAIDPSGRLARADIGELSSSQDGLNALARDTGGRTLINTNDLASGVTRALIETSTYYLIAWRPESEEQRRGRSTRIDVSVVGRPGLLVRLRRGFTEKESPTPVAKQKPKRPDTPEKQIEDELRGAIKALYPAQALPTALVLQFLDTPGTGPALATAMQITTDPAVFALVEGKPTANIELGGVVYDVEGKVAASFRNRITMKATSLDPKASVPNSFSYNHQFKLKPGLYQVRVAAREEKSGRTGSARHWIEIPDLISRRLVLSSLILGERTAETTELISPAQPFGQAKLSIDHHFARTSHLRFLTFVYNAALSVNSTVTAASDANKKPGSVSAATPDIVVQVQVLRDGQPVVTTTMRKIEAYPETDLARLPYAADIPLSELQPGLYLLQVTVIDRIAKASAIQQAGFVID